MTRKLIRIQLTLSLCLTLILALLPQPVQARGETDIPPLEDFIQQVSNDQADSLSGIYVPDGFASLVVSQPTGKPMFVSTEKNTLTQFNLAARYGSIGLLAHNYLAGKTFSLLAPGQMFYLIYGDGTVATFNVTQRLRFQALDPENVHSDFIDLDTGDLLTAAELFIKVYDQPGKVILQTCITSHGNSSWGRLFIIAEPIVEY